MVQLLRRLPVNLKAIDLNLLLVFAAVYKHGSLTAAGDEIGLSQPAMSGALRRLRSVFQDQLFVRLSHGMGPTSRAEQLAPLIHEVLQRLQVAVAPPAPFVPASSTRAFTLFMNDLGEAALLPQLLERVRREAPGVSLLIPDLHVDELPQALEHGDIDLVIGVYPALDQGFLSEHLLEETYVCIIRETHPVLVQGLTQENFAQLSHASFTASGNVHRVIDEVLRTAGIHRRVAVEVPHFVVIPSLIANSDLVVILPRTIGEWFERFLSIKVVQLPFSFPSFHVNQYWHERRHEDGGVVWLRALVRDSLATLHGRSPRSA